MVVLLVLLLLSNLWFGWAVGSARSSNSFNSIPDIADILRELKDIQENKEKKCVEIKGALGSLAFSKNWKVKADENGIMSIELPNGQTYVINKDCKVTVTVRTGTLSPLNEKYAVSLAPGMLTMEDFKFKVDVSLFRTLFQMLMYAAAIFWAVRVAQRFIAGDLTETLITLFIGFIIVASMYVLYKWMPA